MAFEILVNIHVARNHFLQQLLDSRLIFAMQLMSSTKAADLKHIKYETVVSRVELSAQDVEIECRKAPGNLRKQPRVIARDQDQIAITLFRVINPFDDNICPLQLSDQPQLLHDLRHRRVKQVTLRKLPKMVE